MIKTNLKLVAALAIPLHGCGPSLYYDEAEVARVSSPDGVVDAVLFSRDVGATADTAYHVAVTGDKRGHGGGATVLVADKVDDPKDIALTWKDDRTLLVRIPQCRTFEEAKLAEVDGRSIQIRFQR